jgi:hypothetical protein
MPIVARLRFDIDATMATNTWNNRGFGVLIVYSVSVLQKEKGCLPVYLPVVAGQRLLCVPPVSHQRDVANDVHRLTVGRHVILRVAAPLYNP